MPEHRVGNEERAELDDGDVKDYLEAHQAEVVDMLLTEYDEEKTLKAEYYAGERAGLKKGLQEGLAQGLRAICELVADGDLSIDAAVRKAAKFDITSEADLRRSAAGFGIQLPE